MKPVMQTKFTTENQSVHGNCLAACLASLLEVPLDEVPPIEDAGADWFNVMYEFLHQHGYDYRGTAYPTGDDWLHAVMQEYPGVNGYFIVGGKSPREWVTRGHAVIYKDGAMVHDPHPSNAGLTEVEDVMLIRRKV